MKKKILLTLLVVAILTAAFAVSASAETVSHKCEACGQVVTWEPLNPKAGTLTAGTYHYYLPQSYGATQTAQLIAGSGAKLCLDLYGNTFSTAGRALLAKDGGKVNVQDSKGGGALNGGSGWNNPGSGTAGVAANSEFNLYSGTLRFTKGTTGYGTGRGGVFGVEGSGTFNMYGGTIEGGELVMSTYGSLAQSTSNGCGAAVYVYGTGNMNVYGGEILSGTVPAGGRGECIYLASNTAKLTLSGTAQVENIYAEAAGGVNISGTYTGKARLVYGTGVALSTGLKLGTATNSANLSGADIACINNTGWSVTVSGSDVKLAKLTSTGTWHWCQHCKDVMTWLPLADNIAKQSVAGHHHLYMTGKYSTANQLNMQNGAEICLDLYGQTFDSSRRAIHVTAGTLNLMDTVGGGEVIGRTGTNNPDAGVLAVKNGSVLNMYSGTVKFIKQDVSYGTGRGGVMTLEGTMNLYGGTLQGGDMVVSTYYSVTYNGCGGAMYLFSTAQLNIYGGKILSGSVPAGKYGPCIFVENNKAKINITGDAQVDDIFFIAESSDNFTVTGNFTGNVNLSYLPAVAISGGSVVGSCADGDISGGTLTCGSREVIAVNGKLECSTFSANTVAGIVTATSEIGYDSLQEALNAYTEGYIQLCASTDENVTVGKTAYLDLNGYSIGGTVTVADGAVLYGMDNRTDDYDVSDGVYGKLTAVTQGTGKIMGAEAEGDRDAYLMVEESGKLSFHRLTLQVYAMTLRPQVAGLYYNSRFLADEPAAAKIASFGVALSLQGIPNSENMDKIGEFTTFTGFEGGANGNQEGTSTLLTGILKEENSYVQNVQNLNTTVYGIAYAKTTDGQCLVGLPVYRSLMAQLEDVETMTDELNNVQAIAIGEMYGTFETVLNPYGFAKLAKEYAKNEGEYLRILMVGNSHGLDATNLLCEVFKAEMPEQKFIVGSLYCSGCTMPMHAQHASNNEKAYDYYKNDGSNANGAWEIRKESTILDALQDEQWDIVIMQQQNEQNGIASSWNATAFQTVINYINNNQPVQPKLLWQMLWVNPDDYSRYIGANAPLAHPSADWYKTYYETNFPGADGKYDHEVLYNKIISLTQQNLVNSNDFLGQAYYDGIIPASTTVEYALDVIGRPQYEMYRDWTHLSDYGRLMVAYQWYAEIMELDEITEVNVNEIPAALHQAKSTYPADLKVTQAMKEDIIEAVNWTLENPYTLPEERPETPSETAYFTADPGEDDTFRVLMVGNSACYYYADELYALLAGAGIKAEVWNVYYSGCNVKQHWTWLNTNAANYQLICNSAAGRQVYSGKTMEACLLTANWDVITLQQAVFPEMCYNTQATLDATLPYANSLIQYFRERFPKANFMWHQVWAFEIGFYPLAGEKENSPDAYKVLDIEKRNLYHNMNCTVSNAVCEANDLPLIPTGDAWEIARKSDLIGTTLCARLGVRGDEGDYGHDGDIGGGQYLNACVWFEVLTGQSCVGNTWRPSYALSEEKIAVLQAAAHQAVAELNG